MKLFGSLVSSISFNSKSHVSPVSLVSLSSLVSHLPCLPWSPMSPLVSPLSHVSPVLHSLPFSPGLPPLPCLPWSPLPPSGCHNYSMCSTRYICIEKLLSAVRLYRLACSRLPFCNSIIMKFPTAYEERHAFWYLQLLLTGHRPFN